MTTHFPQEIFKNILSYCDDTIERKQRNLWNTIKPVRSHRIARNPYESKYDKTTMICIGFDIGDEYVYNRNWLIWWDHWDLDEDEGGCLRQILEDETTWFNMRESGNISNLS
jgi:hypothetical protein